MTDDAFTVRASATPNAGVAYGADPPPSTRPSSPATSSRPTGPRFWTNRT
ncbi:MAG: hypothetical protein WBA11_08840 [Rubrivirga sp.]